MRGPMYHAPPSVLAHFNLPRLFTKLPSNVANVTLSRESMPHSKGKGMSLSTACQRDPILVPPFAVRVQGRRQHVTELEHVTLRNKTRLARGRAAPTQKSPSAPKLSRTVRPRSPVSFPGQRAAARPASLEPPSAGSAPKTAKKASNCVTTGPCRPTTGDMDRSGGVAARPRPQRGARYCWCWLS